MSIWHNSPKASLALFCAFTVVLLMLLLSPAVVAQQTRGQVVDWLYEVEQFVPDQSDRARLAAAQRSLLRVLSRTTGLASVPRSPTVAKALITPEHFYTKYVYFDPRDLNIERRGQRATRPPRRRRLILSTMRRAAPMRRWRCALIFNLLRSSNWPETPNSRRGGRVAR